MAAGSGGGLPPRQQERLERDLTTIREQNGLDVSLLVGDLDLDDLSQFRAGCERLHAALGPRSDSAVLVVVAPGQRRVEVVTGQGVLRRVQPLASRPELAQVVEVEVADEQADVEAVLLADRREVSLEPLLLARGEPAAATSCHWPHPS